jgi:hypothetical protein
MKLLRKIHLYLGCFFAPMLILFVLTGAAQFFGLRLGILSEIHVRHYGSVPFILLTLLMGLSVVVTAILGIVMALRQGNSKKAAWACLTLGVIVPVVLLLFSHNILTAKQRALQNRQPPPAQQSP